MKNRVLIVSPTQGTYGGIEITAVAQAELLQDHLAPLLHFKLTKGFETQTSLTEVADASAIHYKITERGFGSLWKSISKSDIVHGHNVSIDVVIPALLLAKPLYFTIHNKFHPNSWRHWMAMFLQHVSRYRVYNSGFVRRTWFGDHTRHSTVFPSISRLPEVKPLPSAEKRGFFYIGRWIANKGIETLIEAYAQADIDKSLHPLHLAGSGPLKTSILKRVEEEKLQGIQYLGFISEEEKFEKYRSVKWNVAAANTREDMGLTPIEARHSGTPSIVSRDGGLPEAGGPAAIICEAGSVESLKSAIEAAARMDYLTYQKRCSLAKDSLNGYLKDYSLFRHHYGLSNEGEPQV